MCDGSLNPGINAVRCIGCTVSNLLSQQSRTVTRRIALFAGLFSGSLVSRVAVTDNYEEIAYLSGIAAL
ncbi:MAG: hypothetical protein EF813_04435 [Methanosarcinales archaeon]|nr:MAG: hypothetical protein EF813_04435 [Methanosarcinales archaeon]